MDYQVSVDGTTNKISVLCNQEVITDLSGVPKGVMRKVKRLERKHKHKKVHKKSQGFHEKHVKRVTMKF